MTITLNSIPVDVRTFGQFIEFDSSRAVQGLPGQPHKALLIGQRLSAGTVAKEVPTRVPSSDASEAAFGRGSILADMCRAFKVANPYTELWAVALDDVGAGTKGTKTVTITGPATADGAIYLYIAGHRVVSAVADDDVQNDIATALKAAIDAAAANAKGGFPVVASVATNVVTLTAQHKGTLGNKVDVRLNYGRDEALPTGVTIAIAAGVTGVTDPDVQDAIDAIGGAQYNTIATAYSDDTNMDALEADLDTRWGAMEAIEGHAFFAVNDTTGNLSSAGNARNSSHSTLMGVGLSPSSPWVIAAVTAATDAAEPHASRPRQTLELVGIKAPSEPDQFTRTERNVLLTDGISTAYVDDSGKVRIERLITTYQTNALSVADTSYLDVTTVRTLAYIRYAVRTRFALKFPRMMLADDDANFGAGAAVVTPKVLSSELISLFKDLEQAAYVEGIEQFITDLRVERDATDPNRVNALIPPDLMNQFIVFAGQIQFLL